MLRVRETDDSLIAEITEVKILDEGTILETGQTLMDLLPRADGKTLIVDFRHVQFMSSAMIGKLVMLHKKAKADQIDLRLYNITPNVMEVFKLTRLNKIFNIGSDEEAGKSES